MIFEHITDVVGESLPQQDEGLDSAHRQADAHVINTHPMITRGKSGTVKPELHVYNATNIPFDPANVHVAMRIKPEILIPLLENQKVVGCRWLFKVEKKANGTVDRYKVQLVAKEYAQKAGFDYHDTFSPVAETCTVHTLIALAFNHQWQLRQGDVNNAFLNVELLEEVYMTQPPRFEQYDDTGNSLIVFHTIDEVIRDLNQEFSLKNLGELNYFLGIEVHRQVTTLHLSQKKYITELLQKAEPKSS
ncbi:putative LRR receptor-like serine/threonine-protein kinase [Gossypium australe]|uniref:Putative LRR receptor-like serine/threonine-protein kinase n=1 Tax=Gossypium australe TaxID=47621 RepID=A0A5B6W9N0_9ROSI|nr:putative LRR receptor-like serine/threonine-protein kinase [Gossypium australe]